MSPYRGQSPSTAPRPKRQALRPAVEALEGRTLLAQFFTGPSAVRPVQTTGGVFTFAVSGPGLIKTNQLGKGVVGVTVFGSTAATTLSVAMTKQRLHQAAGSLSIGSIRVVSGQIGQILAGSASLVGTVSPLGGGVGSLQFGGLGPNARIDVNGTLGSLGVGGVNLGPNGHVRIGESLGQGLTVSGPWTVDGGEFSVGADLSGPLNVGSVHVMHGGRFSVGHDLSGGAQVAVDLDVASNGSFTVGHNLGGLTVGNKLSLETGGILAVGNDLTGAVSVGAGMSLSGGSRFVVVRDVPGSITVTGDVNLASNGVIGVGRALNALTVNGDLVVDPSGGGVVVGGNFNNLTVNGMIRGQGSKTAADLTVGLDLGRLTVLGSSPNQGGIQGANIDVGKSILGLDVRHGIFSSLITAGVLIDGGGSGGGGGNVGPDGPDAIVNSELRAGVRIQNLINNGNVRSTFATDPAATGFPTRIIAGESRQGVFTGGGVIDNFQILGEMFDSVIAASVKPNGGNGTLPTFSYGTPPASPTNAPGDLGFNTYDAPAGTITGGTVGAPVRYPNFSELSYYNETLTGVTWNNAIDPTIDDFIFPGAINPSFASPPVAGASLADPTTILPLPTKSTVLGGVSSSAHGDNADYAGILAADTRGVFVGNLPK